MNSNPQVSPIQFGSQFVDINPRMGLDGRGPLLFGVDAIRSGLIILLQSHVGVQSKTFNQFYGSGAFEIFEEPIDQISAMRLRAAIFACIERFELRVALNHGDCVVEPNSELAGYFITLSYSIRDTGVADQFSFNLV